MANPFRASINVATDRGFKLQEKVTKGLSEDELYNISQSKIKTFKAATDEVCNRFYWGTIIQAVPIEHDDARVVLETASLLWEPPKVPIAAIKENAE